MPLRNYLLCLLLLLTLSSAAEGSHPPLPCEEQRVLALCERVVDGDTAWFQVEEDGVLVTHKVRFLCIDTPETVHPNMEAQPFGREASDYVQATLEGKLVWLEYDQQRLDRYGRHLCHIWLQDGTLFNLQLVELGYAKVTLYPPNTKYSEHFLDAEEKAINLRRGLWGLDLVPSFGEVEI